MMLSIYYGECSWVVGANGEWSTSHLRLRQAEARRAGGYEVVKEDQARCAHEWKRVTCKEMIEFFV